jgi:hypothetical protein
MTIDVSTLKDCPVCQLSWEYMADCYKCLGTGVNQETGAPCFSHSSCKHSGLEFCKDRECGAHCCKGGQTGPFSRLIGVQYEYGSPERYDGVSEWVCPGCETRWGRWSGKVLTDSEVEMRFGGK